MRAAVRLMYAGAAVGTVNLIVNLAVIADIKAHHAVLGHRLPAATASQASTTLAITELIAIALIPVALWLWMAHANGQGRTWSRSLSTVLFALATLDLPGVFGWPPGIHLTFVPVVVLDGHVVFGPAIPLLTWLVGLAAVWLLWRPTSTDFFRPGFAQAMHQAQQAMHQAQMAELARIRSSRTRMLRRV
jgi:hypothetical protein